MTDTFTPNTPPPAPFTNLPTQVLSVLQQQGIDINYLQNLPTPIPPDVMNSVLQQANIPLPMPGQPPSPEAITALQNAGYVLPDFSKLPSPDQVNSAFQQAGLSAPNSPMPGGPGGPGNPPNFSALPTEVLNILQQQGIDTNYLQNLPMPIPPHLMNSVLQQANIPLPMPGQPPSPEAITALQNAGYVLPDFSKLPSPDQVNSAFQQAGLSAPTPPMPGGPGGPGNPPNFSALPTEVLNILQQQGIDTNYLQNLPIPIPPDIMNSVLQQANIALPLPGQPPSPEAITALQNAGYVLPDFSKLPTPDQVNSAFQQAGLSAPLPMPGGPGGPGGPGLFPVLPQFSPEAITALENAGYNLPDPSQIPTPEIVDQLLNQAGFDSPNPGEMPRHEIVNQVLTQAGIALPPPPTPGSAPTPFSPEAIAALQNAGITLPDMSKIPSQDQIKQVLANAGYSLPDPSQLPTPQQVNDILTQAGIPLPMPPAGMASPPFPHFNTINPINDSLIVPNTITSSSIVPIANFSANTINTVTGGVIDPLHSVVYDPATVIYVGLDPTSQTII